MDQGLWECGRGEKDMHAIPSSSMYFRHINSGLFRRAENRNCASIPLITWLISHLTVNALKPFTWTLTEKFMRLSSLWVLYSIINSSWSILNIFKVEGQGFKVDATRLTAHSKFLQDMLFDSNGLLGTAAEGTVDNPIIIQGCTIERFANFLKWLNHECVGYFSIHTYSLLI